MKYLRQYMGLRKELYVLFLGVVVTNMGALIWPMMTLILKNKLGYSASQIAVLLLILGCIQLPCTLIGGKLADRFNKRNLIIVCDLVTVVSYMICGFMPVSEEIIPLMAIAAIFAQMEWPSYDALVADFSTTKDRERAYSLNYLGVNLGLVLAPILGGFLFEKHLNLAFIISSVATLTSTVCIFFFIKDVRPEKAADEEGHYEKLHQDQSIWKILQTNKLLMLFMLCGGMSMLVYNQFYFLVPISLEEIYSAQGAVWFGTLSSLNAAVVIIGTPVLTKYATKIQDADKLLIGQTLIVLGYIAYILVQNSLLVYFISVTIFTLGEVCETLGRQPYLTRRIPASHRGRFSSCYTLFASVFRLLGQQVVGQMVDTVTLRFVWSFVVLLGVGNMIGLYVLRTKDKKVYGLLYK